MKAVYFQNDFSAGMLPENLSGRLDSPAYGKGAKILKNVFIEPSGAVTRREGWTIIDAYTWLNSTLVNSVSGYKIASYKTDLLETAGEYTKSGYIVFGMVLETYAGDHLGKLARILYRDMNTWVQLLEDVPFSSADKNSGDYGGSKPDTSRTSLWRYGRKYCTNIVVLNLSKGAGTISSLPSVGWSTGGGVRCFPRNPERVSMIDDANTLNYYGQAYSTTATNPVELYNRLFCLEGATIKGSVVGDYDNFDVPSGAISLSPKGFFGRTSWMAAWQNRLVIGGSEGFAIAEIDPVTITNSKVFIVNGIITSDRCVPISRDDGVYYYDVSEKMVCRLVYSQERARYYSEQVFNLDSMPDLFSSVVRIANIVEVNDKHNCIYALVGNKVGSGGIFGEVASPQIVCIHENGAITYQTLPTTLTINSEVRSLSNYEIFSLFYDGEERLGLMVKSRISVTGDNKDSLIIMVQANKAGSEWVDFAKIPSNARGEVPFAVTTATYDVEVTTLPIEVQTQSGLSLLKKKTLTNAALRVRSTKSVTIGPESGSQYAAIGTTEVTGDVEINLSSNADWQQALQIKQTSNSAFELQFIRAELEVSDL